MLCEKAAAPPPAALILFPAADVPRQILQHLFFSNRASKITVGRPRITSTDAEQPTDYTSGRPGPSSCCQRTYDSSTADRTTADRAVILVSVKEF